MHDSAQLYEQSANAAPKDLGSPTFCAQAKSPSIIDEAKSFLDRAANDDAYYYRVDAIRGEVAKLGHEPEV